LPTATYPVCGPFSIAAVGQNDDHTVNSARRRGSVQQRRSLVKWWIDQDE
jgi:hypothetical protein